MNIFIIAGYSCEVIKQTFERDGIANIVGSEKSMGQALQYLKTRSPEFDSILITDHGVNCSDSEFKNLLAEVKRIVNSPFQNVFIKFVTKEPGLDQAFKEITGEDQRFKVYLTDKIKIPMSLLKDACLEKHNFYAENTVILDVNPENENKKLKSQSNAVESLPQSSSQSVKKKSPDKPATLKSCQPPPDKILELIEKKSAAEDTSTLQNIADKYFHFLHLLFTRYIFLLLLAYFLLRWLGFDAYPPLGNFIIDLCMQLYHAAANFLEGITNGGHK